MKMKEIFKKVDTYNEIAEKMMTSKAQILFGWFCNYEKFSNYSDFSKYIRKEYIKEVADQILNSDAWEIDGELEIHYGGGVFAGTSKFVLELVSA